MYRAFPIPPISYITPVFFFLICYYGPLGSTASGKGVPYLPCDLSFNDKYGDNTWQWRIQGGCPRQAPASTDQHFLNFMQFLGKSGKFVCWRSPSWRVGAPPWGILDLPLLGDIQFHNFQSSGKYMFTLVYFTVII